MVAAHEQIEAMLCIRRAISESSVSDFDHLFETERNKGEHDDEDEPGDDVRAPYRKEHFFSTNIEALICGELDINFQEYEKVVYSLP
jgi:hypothetical protein